MRPSSSRSCRPASTSGASASPGSRCATAAPSSTGSSSPSVRATRRRTRSPRSRRSTRSATRGRKGRWRWSSPACARRSWSCRAAGSSSTTPGTRTPWRCGPRWRISRSARTAAAPSRSSATWPSSGPTGRATTRRSAAQPERSAIVIGVGPLARGYDPDAWAPTAAEAAELARELVQPGDVVLVKGSRSVGLEVVAEALQQMTRVLIAGLVALIVSIVIGPRFIEFLRRNEFGQHIREDGPEHHSAQAGDADDGRPAHPLRGDGRVPAGVALHGCSRSTVLFATLGCGAIGFLDDFIKLHAQALARPARALEAPAARRDHRRRRARRAPSPPEHRRLRAARERLHPALVGAGTSFLFLDHRGRVERHEPRRTASTASPPGRGSSRSSRSRR